MKLIGHGAEAKVYEKIKSVLKKRVKKGYRHPSIDIRLRKLRTRSEAKLLNIAHHYQLHTDWHQHCPKNY